MTAPSLDRSVPTGQALPKPAVVEDTADLHRAGESGIGGLEDVSIGSTATSSTNQSAPVSTATGTDIPAAASGVVHSAQDAAASALHAATGAAASLFNVASSYLPTAGQAQEAANIVAQKAVVAAKVAAGVSAEIAGEVYKTTQAAIPVADDGPRSVAPAPKPTDSSVVGELAESAPGGDRKSELQHTDYDIVRDGKALLGKLGGTVNAVGASTTEAVSSASAYLPSTEEMKKAAAQGHEAATDTTDRLAQQIKDGSNSVVNAASNTAEQARTTTANAANTVSQQASDTANAVSASASNAADIASQKTSEVTSTAKQYVPSTSQVKDQAAQGRDTAFDNMNAAAGSLSVNDSHPIHRDTDLTTGGRSHDLRSEGVQDETLVGGGGLAATIADDVADAARVSSATSAGGPKHDQIHASQAPTVLHVGATASGADALHTDV